MYDSLGYVNIRGEIHDAKLGRQLQNLQKSIEVSIESIQYLFVNVDIAKIMKLVLPSYSLTLSTQFFLSGGDLR